MRVDIKLRLHWPAFTPMVKRLLIIIGPAALGAGAVQFNLLISTALAARFLPEGAVSYLYYADRLNQLPLGLIGIGVGTALLPALSRQLGAGNADIALHTQNRAIELVLLLTLPAAAALVVSAVPIISGLLEGGAFTARDSAATAAALAAFSQQSAALLFSSGWSANTGLWPALTTAADTVFSHVHNHTSTIDGLRLARAQRPGTADPHIAQALLEQHGGQRGGGDLAEDLDRARVQLVDDEKQNKRNEIDELFHGTSHGRDETA